MNNKTLSHYIREFLVTYLGTRRNCSIHTIQSYRDTIQLFINYNITEKNVDPSKLNFDILNIENVNEFLDYLEKNRNSTINTRNQRLACIKSLCNYILTYETTNLETFQKILNIKSKKHNSKTIDFLTKEEIKELLNKPNSSTKQGLKDLTVLTLLYDGALRVSELINLKTEDIILDEPSSIIIKQAKGNKSRVIPLTKNATEILKRYKQNFNLESGMIFIQSNQKEAYTSNGIRKIIKKYSNNFRFNITPHTFRHTKASHLVESNVPLIYIRDFLGHESIETTEIYAKVNNKIKDKIIAENTVKLGINVKYNIDEDPNLLNWLKSL